MHIDVRTYALNECTIYQVLISVTKHLELVALSTLT